MKDNSWLSILVCGLIITLCLTPIQWEFKLLIFTITILVTVVISSNFSDITKEIKLLQKSKEERQLHIDSKYDEIERQIWIASGANPLKAMFLNVIIYIIFAFVFYWSEYPDELHSFLRIFLN